MGMGKRVRLTLLENLLVPLSDVDPVPSATGNIKFSLFIDVNTSFALSLLASIPHASISSDSSMSEISMSPFQILTAFNAYQRNIPGKSFGPN